MRISWVFRWVFRGCSLRISWVFVGCFVGVRCIIAIRLQCFGNPFATKWQTTSSRRGPIHRAREYEYTHEMGDENACAIM
ncbi:hypothetical protein, partial [Prevotella pallens]|uniref:hypothetical protein n=1 Tax=Prevotella pallens TaxID=60133 RepID=UPI0023F243D9